VSDQETPPEQAPETSAPLTGPDGQPWDPDRAMSTIKSLRERESELEPQAKQYERLSSGEDQDAFRELAEKYGFQIEDQEDDDSDEWVDPSEQKFTEYEKKLAALEQAEEQRQLDAQAQHFRSTVDSLAKENELDLQDYHVTGILQNVINRGDLTDKNIKAAFFDIAKAIEAERQAIIDGYTKSKKAPRGPLKGEAASEVPELKSTEDIVKHVQSQIGG